ncbi:hypothetical protein BASA61_002012 [Batrachochytrium salamandrivorans]|nr:hypothetical protein BASA62_007039 [Batrachochytrium salamandrivorans]KAH6583224.1 hypothetical protein BASA60_001543 [Batrachochytrium salamandrivorans]KAH6601242.1 hypothetical protein BASA61_002012 [Batrachochytrium salamandrivorans]KAH9271555.1 hypothetical protein BASA83_006163 [Batrachochytrium salamandrivorans]
MAISYSARITSARTAAPLYAVSSALLSRLPRPSDNRSCLPVSSAQTLAVGLHGRFFSSARPSQLNLNSRHSLAAASRYIPIWKSQYHPTLASQARSFWSWNPAAAALPNPTLPSSPTTSNVVLSTNTALPTTNIQDTSVVTPLTPLVDTNDTTLSVVSSSLVPEGTDIADLVSETTITAITNIGDLHSLGLANHNPVGLFQALAEVIYVYSGIPWWGTILVVTLIVRLIVTPLAIKSQLAGALLGALRPKTDPIQKKVTRLRSIGDSSGAQQEARKLFQIYKDNKVSPFSIGWGLIQAPIFISVFMAIKSMAELPVPGFSTGGFGWITDLTAADPLYIMPVISSIGMVVAMEYSSTASGAPPQSPMMLMIIRIGAIVMIPMMGGLPAAVFIYMVGGTLLMFLQMQLMTVPAIRQWIGFPKIIPAPPQADTGILTVKPISLLESYQAIRHARAELKKNNAISRTPMSNDIKK